MFGRRLIESCAMLIIGDSVLCAVDPKRHVELWREGPGPWPEVADFFDERPTLTRLCGVGGVLFGLWLATRQRPQLSAGRWSSLPEPVARVARANRAFLASAVER